MSSRSVVPCLALAAALAAPLALGGCHGSERKAKADTGTAEVVVKTKAPAGAVSDSQLQQQAQAAATAASTPVDGSHMNTLTPSAPANGAH